MAMAALALVAASPAAIAQSTGTLPVECLARPVGPDITVEALVPAPRDPAVTVRVNPGPLPTYGTHCRITPPPATDILRGPPARDLLKGDEPP